MIKIKLFSILYFFYILNIYPQWTNQNPVPNGNDLWSTFFVDVNIGWIVGSNGFIIKTTNSGLDWIQQNGGTTLNLKSVQFIDQNIGWICGEGGLILKTTNGGLNWFLQMTGSIENLTDIYFCNANTGYAVGYGGTILKTENGGLSWIKQTSSANTYDLFSLDFVNDLIGYAVGGTYWKQDSFRILKTTNGGIDWSEKPLPNGSTFWSSLNTVEFVDANTGWIGIGYGAMNKGNIYKTTDGGDSWTQQFVGTMEKKIISIQKNSALDSGDGIRSIFFKDSNNGYAVSGTIGYARSIWTTTNGGTTWIQKCYEWESDGLLSICISNGGKGWAVGYAGIIYITENDGNSWFQILSGIQSYFYSGDDIYSVFCLNENICWAVGHRQGGGGGGSLILNTTDGGKIWKTQLYVSSSSKPITSVQFIDENFGWALGYNGLWRTTDGGKNWIKGNIQGKALFFRDKNVGWLVKETFNIYSDAIFKTTDGGVTWIPKSKLSGLYIYFVDRNNGWVVGNNGIISKSTDGGESWITKISETSNDLNCIKFFDSNLGMCVGNQGTVLLSTDGGEIWVPKNVGTAESLTAIEFTNANTVWVSGSNGTILNTIDLGNNWTNYNTVTANNLTSLCFINENRGWIGGIDGTIFKYQNYIVPVELVSFKADVKNNTVQLNWQTSTEINNFGFEIERKYDKEEWNTIGFVEGQGNSISPKSYSFTDKIPLGAIKLQYRLKQMNTDGSFEYSDIVDVQIAPYQYDMLQNYPNPFNPTTKIKFEIPAESDVNLSIYDISGELVTTLVNLKLKAGNYEYEFDGSGLSSGVYFYTIKASSFVATKKMILIK